MRLPSLHIARCALLAVLGVALLAPPLLAQGPADEVPGGPLAPSLSDPILDLAVLDAVDVDPTTGALLFQREDMRLGQGADQFVIRRTYRPLAGDALNLGYHWVSSLDMHLELHEDGSAASLTTEDGRAIEFRRESDGRLRAIEGRAASIRELPRGYLVSGLGDEARYLFDSEGWLRVRRTSTADVRFAYDTEQRLEAVHGPWGSLELERDEHGVLTVLRAPAQTVHFQRTPDGLLSRVTREGAYEDYGYDRFGRLSSLAGGLAHIRWDGLSRVLAIHGDGVHPIRLTYVESDNPEAALQVTKTTLGKTESVCVSADRRRIEHWNHGAEEPSISWLDARDRLIRFVGSDGAEIRYRYDDEGRLSERADPSGTTTFAYGSSATDRPTRVGLPDGRAIEFGFDDTGNLLAITSPEGLETRFEWEGGRLVTSLDPRGNATRYGYDERGYVTLVEGPDGETLYHRDEAGRVQAVLLPDGRIVTVTRDTLGRLTKLADGRGSILELELNARGQVVRRRDELGRSYHYEWNARGDLLCLSDSLGTLSAYEYDADGQPVATIDGAGNRTTVDHPDARTTLVNDPSFGTRTLRHDDQGRLEHELRGEHALSYRYDEQGLLAQRTTPAGVETFAYDEGGRIARLEGPAGGYALDYDEHGRLTALTNLKLEQRVEYGYDALGDRTEARMPWGTVGYEYDQQGRVAAVILPNEGGRIELERNVMGRRTLVRYPNGVNTSYRYERDQLVEVSTTRGDQQLDRRAYGYDSRGRMAWSEDLDGRTEYEHDARGRLLREDGPQGLRTYAYDGAGNRISETIGETSSELSVAAGNRIVKALGRELAYGASGAVTSVTEGQATTRYTYDHDDKLVAVESPDGQVVRYGYAPNGTRLWRDDGNERVDFLHDGPHVVGEFVGDELQSAFVRGPDVDDLLAASHGERDYFYHRDLVGSVTALTGADGDVVARYSYDAFGRDLGSEGEADWNPYRYTARALDTDTGLYDYRARSYDPALGRFTSPDPMGKLGGFNLYAYVDNDPTQFTDPFGLKPWWQRWGKAIGDSAVWLGEKAVAIGAATGKGLLNVVTNPVAFAKGFGLGVWSGVKGTLTLLNPTKWDDIANGIAYAIDHWDETKEALGNGWDEFTDALHNDPEKFAEMMGKFTGAVALSAVGAKGLDKLGAVTRVSQLAGKAGAVVSRTAGSAGRAVTSRLPSAAADMVRRSAAWSARRTSELAAQAAHAQNLGFLARTGRRFSNFGRGVVNYGRMGIRAPGSTILYTGRRLSRYTAGLVGSTASGLFKATRIGAIPLMVLAEDQITDAINRTKTHDDALEGVGGAAQDFLGDVGSLSPERLAERLQDMGNVYRDYRNQLFRPVHEEDKRLQAELAELNEKVGRGEVSDNAIDARMGALFSDYSSRRLNHVADIYTRGTEEEHDKFRPSRNRLLSFLDEIDLYKAALDRVTDPESRKLLERKIAELEALMAYENELFRQGEHETLIAGVAHPPEDFMTPDTGRLQGLIDPAASQGEGF